MATARWTSPLELKDLLKTTVHRKCEFPASAYFRASEEMERNYITKLAASRGLDSTGLSHKHVVPSGNRKRAKMFVELAKQKLGPL
eukprot:7539616-Pyramimonas_sp.AAC.1